MYIKAESNFVFLLNVKMLPVTNGNLYRSNPADGTTQRTTKRKASTLKPIGQTKYKKYSDMPLSDIQKKQIKAMQKKSTSSTSELNYYEVSAGAQASSYTWQLVKLSAISQGSLDSNRKGDEIYLKDIEFKWRPEYGSSGTQQSCALRMVLVQYYNDDGLAPPNGNNFFNQNTTNISYLCYYQHDYRRQYKILYDETAILCLNGQDSTMRTVVVKPGRHKVRYDAATNTGDGQIYACYISDYNTAGVAPVVDISARLNFYDS